MRGQGMSIMSRINNFTKNEKDFNWLGLNSKYPYIYLLVNLIITVKPLYHLSLGRHILVVTKWIMLFSTKLISSFQ